MDKLLGALTLIARKIFRFNLDCFEKLDLK